MKKIDKQKFDRLLKEDKDAALGMLKDGKGDWLKKVEIGDKSYKIFSEIPDDLFTNYETKRLPNDFSALILCDVNYEEEVLRTQFDYWYFLGNTSFNNSKFQGSASFLSTQFIGEAKFNKTKFSSSFFRESYFHLLGDFTEAEFKSDVDFSDSNFNGYAKFKKTKFLRADFYNTNFKGIATFREAEFTGMGDANFFRATFELDAYFICATFSDRADFGNAKFFNNVYFKGTKFGTELLFTDTIFKEHCNLRVEKFADFVDFTGADYMRPLSINGKKLYENEKEYSKPIKLISKDKDGKEDLEKTKRNLHNLKKIYNRLEYYDGEDHLYYWYKVFERKSCFCKDLDSNRKISVGKILYFLWIYFRYVFLEKFILDICTGYFTKPLKVFLAIPSTIIIFALIYCVSPDKNHNSFGIQHNFSLDSKSYNEILWEDVNFSIKDLNINEKEKIGLYRKNLYKSMYFSAITFSTIGYGDYQPVGLWTMFFAAIEGIIGVLLMSTFLVTLTRKYLR
jgi:uncharacterized protein YjbI with pentapeptide repeats